MQDPWPRQGTVPMIRRIGRLFDRYAARHLWLAVPGPALPGGGRVDHVARRGNRLEVAGSASARAVTLVCGAERLSQALQGGDGPVAFALDLPWAAGPLALELDPGNGAAVQRVALPGLARGRLRRARLALLPGFGRGMLRALPPALRWMLSRDPALRRQVRDALGLAGAAPARGLNPALFDTVPDATATPAADTPVICILPVYNAFHLLPEVLDRFTRHTDLPWHLLVIEDASTDPAVRPFLRDWVAARAATAATVPEGAGPGTVTLLENDTNLGFIGSVNRGLALARDLNAARPGGGAAPVVLLNADALVPPGWAGRLLRPLLADPAVASATPLSNDAEILSVPVICDRVALAPGQGDAIDAVARRLAPGAGDAALPTGVGFCMAMAPAWLDRVPQFDTAFGPGYGEEVDWCRRTAALGARHVAVADLFVEHRGGTSFGSEAKRRLIARNGATISARYPGYDLEVQDFIAADPLVTARLALGVAWAAGAVAAAQQDRGAGAEGPRLYLTHSMGGGVERYLNRRLAADLARDGAALVLRVGGRVRWRLELHAPGGVTMAETGDFALLERMLAPLGRRCAVYACAVGDPDPLAIPDHLLALCAGPDDRLEVQIHDFFPLSPSCNLLGADGRHAGVPPADSPDPAHRHRRPDGRAVTLAGWRAVWGRLIDRADRIVTFSADSRAHVLAVWPGAAPRLTVVPHRLHSHVPRVTPRPGPRPVVAVLGNLNRQKGSALLAEMAARRDPARDPDLVVIGDTDPACPPGPGVRVHGEYRLADLPLLVRRYQITAWLIPSVWPETFSYATHEALATGLPVFCLDLGAQAEALRAAGQGHRVVPFLPDPAAQAPLLLAALRAGTAAAAPDPAAAR